MTAWSAITICLCVVAKCSLVVVGMEYGDQFQPWSDADVNNALLIAILISGAVDTINFFRTCLGGKR